MQHFKVALKTMLFGLLLVLALAAYVYWRDTEQGEKIAGKTSIVAKPFELLDLQGKPHRLSDYKGKSILLHFWATWCPPCIDELPEILSFAKVNQEKFLMIVISVDKTWEEAMKIFPSEIPKNVISLLDPDGKISDEYGSYQFPETFFIGKNFKIIAKWIGPQKWDNEFFTKMLVKHR